MQHHRDDFKPFVNSMMSGHLSGKNILNEIQFSIIIKRSFDAGFYPFMKEILDELKKKDLITFEKVHKKIHSNPVLNIYGSLNMDFTKPPIKKVLKEIFVTHLEEIMEEKPVYKRNMKI